MSGPNQRYSLVLPPTGFAREPERRPITARALSLAAGSFAPQSVGVETSAFGRCSHEVAGILCEL